MLPGPGNWVTAHLLAMGKQLGASIAPFYTEWTSLAAQLRVSYSVLPNISVLEAELDKYRAAWRAKSPTHHVIESVKFLAKFGITPDVVKSAILVSHPDYTQFQVKKNFQR